MQRSDRKRAKVLASALRTVRQQGNSSRQADQSLLHALILKPVGDRCNLRCRYCFNRQEETKPFTRMSKAVLERAVSAGLTAGSDPVHFIWHGGEPLLAGLDFFRQAVEMQRDLNRTGKRVKNSVQTNGTLLNEEWIEFFRRNTFSISISLDGPSVCHDRYRRYSSGKGSFHKVLNSIHRLQEQHVPFGVLAVITRNMPVSPQEFFAFFVDLGIAGFQLSPCAWPPEQAVTPDEYADLSLGIFAAWFNSGLPQMRVGPLEQMTAAFLGQPPSLCWMAGTCSGFVGIEPDGNVWPCCDRMLPDRYCLGNILEQELSVLLKGRRAEKFRAAEQGKDHCLSCQWSFVCKGGCVHHRILHGGAANAPDPFCSGYQKIFTGISERIDGILCYTRN